ncbi:MAG: type II toxin-antitoxin system Phd/YefM family antitoxin [Acidobacteria bacterium]|nr:type II toxin-antitoxin system Phd/YefM family antitoxin [Acidobacteriota bacterium]MYD72397.1 type II toxin-antitoxin system Phd/YefM family antitoxin [Acidobacteriota bacterium]MYJ04461.1 type II toxin-antitoxin system Phd/YefM family antitoxin [Acidobacteriota bacterium]
MAKSLGATEFRATCLRVIKRLEKDGEPVTITHRGRPVAVLSPAPPPGTRSSIIGAMRGSVLGYDNPFAPATDPSDWTAAR